jgi:hypothetical protein
VCSLICGFFPATRIVKQLALVAALSKNSLPSARWMENQARVVFWQGNSDCYWQFLGSSSGQDGYRRQPGEQRAVCECSNALVCKVLR